MVCREYEEQLDRYLFDQSVDIIQAMLDETQNVSPRLKEAFIQLKRDFDNIYDIAYEQAEILDNIKTELQ